MCVVSMCDTAASDVECCEHRILGCLQLYLMKTVLWCLSAGTLLQCCTRTSSALNVSIEAHKAQAHHVPLRVLCKIHIDPNSEISVWKQYTVMTSDTGKLRLVCQNTIKTFINMQTGPEHCIKSCRSSAARSSGQVTTHPATPRLSAALAGTAAPHPASQ